MENITKFSEEKFLELIEKVNANYNSRRDVSFEAFEEIMSNLREPYAHEYEMGMQKAIFGMNEDEIQTFVHVDDVDLGDKMTFKVNKI